VIRRRFRAPVRSSGDGFVVDLGADEAMLVRRLIGELRQLLADPEPGEEAMMLLHRLFPIAHPDDPDAEEEYQRLMREELVASKLAAFDVVDATLAGDGRLDESGLVAFMQSVNSLRLALGSMLGVTDDPDAEVDPGLEGSAEHHLYGYLSWLLEWSVRAIQAS
jgi:hypothetical protein